VPTPWTLEKRRMEDQEMKYREFLQRAPVALDGSWTCPICPRKRGRQQGHRGNHFGRLHTRKWRTRI
jgi:hypothetical protein